MKDNNLASTILVAALIIAGAIIYSFAPVRNPISLSNNNNQVYNLPPLETNLVYEQTLNNEGDVVLGDVTAKVDIVEYGDYQCPWCAHFFSNNEPGIRENYIGPGKAKMRFKDLIVIGKESADAALAANCAIDQGKFWEYHDALFAIEEQDNKENNGNLTKELFLMISDKLGLDKAVFETCYDSGKYNDEIATDTEEARDETSKKGVSASTPTSFVNGELIRGAIPYKDFAEVIDKYLK